MMSRDRFLCRRDFFTAAGLGLGLLPGLSFAARSAPAGKTIRSCIVLFSYGGPSQLDTFDPKPNAPAEIRGQYRTIPTRVPGTRFTEHLPHLARIADRLAVVRSMHHPMRNHNAAAAE